jgi:hypothetical protein
MTDPTRYFNPPAWTGHGVKMGELWKLTKGNRVAACTLFNHPIGAEVRCEVDGDMRQTKAGRDLVALLDESDKWKQAFAEKGWTA